VVDLGATQVARGTQNAPAGFPVTPRWQYEAPRPPDHTQRTDGAQASWKEAGCLEGVRVV